MHIVIACLIIFFRVAFCSNEESNAVTWRCIEEMNMSSLAYEYEEWSSDDFGYCITRMLNDHRFPKAFRKRQLAYNLFNEQINDKNKIIHNLCDTITLKDLSFFSGNKVDDLYVAQLFETTPNELGKVALYNSMADVTDDKELIILRQLRIQSLLADQKKLLDLADIYNDLAKTEATVLSFWGNDWFNNFIRHNFFNLPGLECLDKSPHAVWGKVILDHAMRVYYTTDQLYKSSVLMSYGLSELCGFESSADMLRAQAELKKDGGYLSDKLWEVSNRKVTGAFSLVNGIIAGMQVKPSFDWMKDNINFEIALQVKLCDVVAYFNNLEKLAHVLKNKSTHFCALHPSASVIIDAFDKNKNYAVWAHYELLKQVSQLSITSNRGALFIAYRAMHLLKKELSQLLKAVSDLNAYVNIALLMHNNNEEEKKICFVNFIESKMPVFSVDEVIHPLLLHKEAVGNSIALGDKIPSKMIITGPNAAGKSTFAKAVITNILLGQSIGVVFAQKASWTMYSYIASYLNIADNVQNGTSRFRAEVMRVEAILNNVHQCSDGKKSFIIFDEFFNGTSGLEGEASVFVITEDVLTMPYVTALIATHFEEVTKLEAQSGLVVNYHQSASVNNGVITFPFKLERGVSTQHIAFDILQQEGFASSLIDKARLFIKKRT